MEAVNANFEGGFYALSWRQVLTYFNILLIIMKNIGKTQKRSIKGPALSRELPDGARQLTKDSELASEFFC